MLLAVDVGNTQTHFGTFDGDELVEHWRFATVRDSTADELGAALRNLLELRGVGLADLEASIVSSTVPAARARSGRRWRAAISTHEMLVVGPGLRTGMPIRIDNPHELGADRLVNAVAAHDRFGGACVSVDFGTAITYDVVSRGRRVPRRHHLAGRRDLDGGADRARGAKLPKIDLAAPRSLIGKSTVDAIRSGVVFGYAGQVDGIVAPAARRAGRGTPTIATGGLAEHIVPFADDDRRGRRPADAHGPAHPQRAQRLGLSASSGTLTAWPRA